LIEAAKFAPLWNKQLTEVYDLPKLKSLSDGKKSIRPIIGIRPGRMQPDAANGCLVTYVPKVHLNN
jgi:hypothetical protein